MNIEDQLVERVCADIKDTSKIRCSRFLGWQVVWYEDEAISYTVDFNAGQVKAKISKPGYLGPDYNITKKPNIDKIESAVLEAERQYELREKNSIASLIINR